MQCCQSHEFTFPQAYTQEHMAAASTNGIPSRSCFIWSRSPRREGIRYRNYTSSVSGRPRPDIYILNRSKLFVCVGLTHCFIQATSSAETSFHNFWSNWGFLSLIPSLWRVCAQNVRSRLSLTYPTDLYAQSSIQGRKIAFRRIG